jgi:predicted TIM-barrel fold metal-dependent hydrolase
MEFPVTLGENIPEAFLSLSAPGIEKLDPEVGTALAAKSNDALARLIEKHPDRFMGDAALAPRDPQAAARELERAVLLLGFRGWDTHSHCADSYLDDKRYLPVLQSAEKLGVPVYLHPTRTRSTL